MVEIFATGCRDTITQTVTLHPTPDVDFTASNLDSCGALTVLFTNNSDPYNGHPQDSMSFVWIVDGDTSGFNAAFDSTFFADSINNADIDYGILLIGTTQYGCVSSFSDTVTIYPDPVSYIDTLNSNVTVNCAPFIIDNSVIDSVEYPNANDTYSWYITDGDNNIIVPAQPSVPNYTMLDDGDTVIVHLVTSNVHLCEQDTARVMFITDEDPVAIYDTSDLANCHPFAASIASNSTPSGLTHYWFIDGVLQPGNPTTFNHPFINPSYTLDTTYQLMMVVLMVEDNNGCLDSTIHTITVYPKPLAQFSLNGDQCANDPFTTDVGDASSTLFNSSSTDSIYSWSIVSPSPTTATINDPTAYNPVFTFLDNQSSNDSTFVIELIFEDSFGCKDTIQDSITIYTRPVAGFEIDTSICGPITVQVTDTSTWTTGLSATHTWSVDDPTVGISNNSAVNPTFTFLENTGTVDQVITVTLVVEIFATGCRDTITQTVTLHPTPDVDFTASNLDSCGALTVLFTNNSDPYNGHPQDSMSFVWIVDGDTSGFNAAFDSTFFADSINNADIDYGILLIGTTQYGCVSSFSDTVTIYPDPVSYIDTLNSNVTVNCAPFIIDNSVIDSVEYPNANDTYSWYITDGDNNIIVPAQPSVPNYTMLDDGDTVIVHLVTSNVHLCEQDTARVMFITDEDPVAIYDTSDLANCHPFAASITSNSTPSGLTHYWFIDGVLQPGNPTTFNHTFINPHIL